MSGRRDIDIDVLGDSPLFSRAGKGVSYLVGAGGSRLLLECGANPFPGLGPDGLRRLGGVIVTHSHFDHHRYLTELALYSRYVLHRPLTVLATEAVAREVSSCCQAAMVRTLTDDGRFVRDVPYQHFIREFRLGPRARCRLERRGAGGRSVWRAIDVPSGAVADPRRAKAVVGRNGTWAHLLVRDAESGEWVEPESFYDFSERAFYLGPDRVWRCAAAGLSVRALKAPSWHGPSSAAMLFERRGARLAFSGDTVYDPALWEKLAERRRRQRLPLSRRSFLAAPTVNAEISALAERTWSRRRLEAALSAYDGAVVFHDADCPGSVVHTVYARLSAAAGGCGARWQDLVLTHTPEPFTSLHPLAYAGARFRVTPRGLRLPAGTPAAWHKEGGRIWGLRRTRTGRLALAFGPAGLRLERMRGGGGLSMRLEAELP